MDELNKDTLPERTVTDENEEPIPSAEETAAEEENTIDLDFPLADAPEAEQEMPELVPMMEIPDTEEVPVEMPTIGRLTEDPLPDDAPEVEEIDTVAEPASQEEVPEEAPSAEEPPMEEPEEEPSAEEIPTEDPAEEAVRERLSADMVLEAPIAQPELIESIGADEEAVSDAGLISPEDLEFEEILELIAQEEAQIHALSEDLQPSQAPAEASGGDAVTQNEENPAQPPMDEGDTQPADEAETTPEVETTEEETEEEAPKKRRPRNTRAYGFFGIPHILTTVIWLGIVVFVGVGLGQFMWNCAADVLALNREDSLAVITITKEDDLDTIAEKLKLTGLIRYPSLFKIYADISDAMDSIKPGTYSLNTNLDYNALVDYMSSNLRRETTNVTIPEGYNCAQMFKLLEKRGVCTVADLEEAAANANLGDYWFLEDVERGSAYCLEGFLFPDTYTFYLGHDPVGVLQKFLNNFNKRFNESMMIKLETLNMNLSERMRANGMSEEYIAEHQMTVRDIVIIASMIEKETSSNLESYNISSVIYNRLTDPDHFPYLQIDATLVYYTGHSVLTMEDLATDHPYNTYTRPGLIPGAISNPGSFSLDAALNPTETDYYFYALDPSTGTHHFSATLQEHNDFLASLKKDEEQP